MRTIFAEYNPQRNSIDIYTNVGYRLLESRKGFKNHTRIRLCIDFTCSRWTTWICEIISWGKFADVGKCRRFIIRKCNLTHRINKRTCKVCDLLSSPLMYHCATGCVRSVKDCSKCIGFTLFLYLTIYKSLLLFSQ